MPDVTMYTTATCPYCIRAKQVLKAKGVAEIDEIRVDLDPAYFALVPAFEKRFPAGPPSLLGATSFTVRGPVTFGAEVTVVGDVHVESADELVIAAGTTLTGDATGDVAGEG